MQPTLDPGGTARYILGLGVGVSDNPWTSGEGASRNPEAGLPNVMDLVSQCAGELQQDFVPFLIAGILPAMLAMSAGVLGVFLIYGGMFLGAAPGIAANDEDLMLIGGAGGMVLGIFALFLGMALLFAPMNASMWRSVWKHMVGEEKLGFDAGFRHAFQDLPRVLVFHVVYIGAILVGSMLCYIPGLIAAFALTFAYPAVIVHGMSIGEAMRISVQHTRDNVAWHLGLFAVAFVMGMVLPYIPFIGYALLFTLYPMFVLAAWRAVYGDGPVSAD
ncbi:MAG: hypothetical protein H6735_12635 [Alphaproteobacteria bacterium]|nr:hypothetical protein [Alphaproteobacteria bacterium]